MNKLQIFGVSNILSLSFGLIMGKCLPTWKDVGIYGYYFYYGIGIFYLILFWCLYKNYCKKSAVEM